MTESLNEYGPEAIAEAIELDRLRLLYAGLPLAIISNALVALAILPLLWTPANSGIALVWLAILALVLTFRLISLLGWRKLLVNEINYDTWIFRFRTGAVAIGLSWGLCCSLLFPIDDTESQLFLAFVLTALMAGAMSSLSVDKTSLAGFVVPILLSMGTELLILNSGISLATLATMTAFAAFMFVSAGRFSAAEQGNIRLRHEMGRRENTLRRYEFIVNTVSDMMSVINRSHCYEAVSNSWCTMLARSREEVIGRTIEDVWGSSLHVMDAKIDRCLAEGIEVSFQKALEFPDAGLRECVVTCYPYAQASGEVTHVVIVTRDITKLVESQRELVEARDIAESASRAKSEFLASMSHELRTPLNAILGFSQLFDIDMELPDETRECGREIYRAGQHLLALVDGLIDLARIESGKLDLSMGPVSVSSVLAESMALIAPVAKKHHVELVDHNSRRVDVMVIADCVRLNQALLNLLSNAVKYNRPSGSVKVSCDVDDKKIRINIIDTGQGIPAENQTRVFQAFDRLGAERGQVEGTGIGLVITRRIVEAMGGKIGFSSLEGKGSTFWLEFPVSDTAMTSEDMTPVISEMPTRGLDLSGAQPKVLLVEDNEVNRLVIRKLFLARPELLLLEADSAEAGIELAQSEGPDLILMDINLPGMDGYQALEILKNTPETSHIKIVALSANAMKGDEIKGLAAGFDDYLTKPIKVQGLFAVIDEVVAG